MGRPAANHSVDARHALTLLSSLLLASCSSENGPSSNPTEEELHASDFGNHVKEPSHAFLCEDGIHLLLIYKKDGLGIELRRESDPRPISLTAAAQGAPFEGDGLTAVMTQRKLILREPGRKPVTCTRQTIG